MNELQKINREELEKKLNETDIKFSQQDIDLLMDGKYSTLKENLQLSDGTIKDGKIKLKIDKDGTINLLYKFKQPEIVIPLKIGEKKFTNDEIEALKIGKAVQVNYNGENLFLQIDKELNTITIKTQHEIKLTEVDKFEMGGYVFDENQKKQLEAGNKVPGVVMLGEQGYFVATISISDDKKGLKFENYKDLTKEQAQELLSKRVMENNSVANMISVTGMTSQFKNENDKSIENTTSVSAIHNEKEEFSKNDLKEDKLSKYEKELYVAVQKGDFEKVSDLAENKPPVSQEFIEKLHNDKSISSDYKVAATTILHIEPLTEKKELNHDKNEKKELSVEKDKAIDKQKSSGNKRRAAKEIINTAFNDM